MSAGRTYPVGIVGEASYQSSIRRCSPGERVEIVHEPDNPYDQRALAVVSTDRLTIGYIAKECWLQDAIHDEGKGGLRVSCSTTELCVHCRQAEFRRFKALWNSGAGSMGVGGTEPTRLHFALHSDRVLEERGQPAEMRLSLETERRGHSRTIRTVF